MKESKTIQSRPFNTPLESGLRSLFILEQINPKFRDLQRLIYYDYLLIHSSDAINSEKSLHPAIPHRSGEWLVRRKLVAEGLELMFAKELIEKIFDERGISYGASELTAPFLKYFHSDYANSLRHQAQIVTNIFEDYSDEKLSSFMNDNLGRWGAEFKRESVIRGLPL
jgi:hypothetical protein